MKKTTIIGLVLGGIAMVGLLVEVYISTNKPIQTVFPQINTITSSDHVKWSPDKKNILVEYGDLQHILRANRVLGVSRLCRRCWLLVRRCRARGLRDRRERVENESRNDESGNLRHIRIRR